jgi:hypothetical protein
MQHEAEIQYIYNILLIKDLLFAFQLDLSVSKNIKEPH